MKVVLGRDTLTHAQPKHAMGNACQGKMFAG